MKKEITLCNICKKQAIKERQQRKENWLQLSGQLRVWLNEPRFKKKGMAESYMHSVGWQNDITDFCSIKCLLKAINSKQSIP